MLKEIFHKITVETEHFLLLKGLQCKVKLGDPQDDPAGGPLIYLAMQDYGIDPFFRNRQPDFDDEAFSSPNFSHLLSFYLLPVAPAYETRLQLLETVVELFETHPFFQLTYKKDTYELAISMKSVNTAEYQQFWMARRQPSQPVVFYQARVSLV